MNFLCLFFQNPACKSLLFNFCCCLIRRKIFFTDMKSFHTRSKSFKKQDTNWLQLLNVLGNNLTMLGVILLHEMYVKSFLFSPAYFWLIWGGGVGYLALLKCFRYTTKQQFELAFPSPASFSFRYCRIPLQDTPQTHTIHTRYSLLSYIPPNCAYTRSFFYIPLDIYMDY